MSKRTLLILLIGAAVILGGAAFSNLLWAQEETTSGQEGVSSNQEVITGVIKSIADDGSKIVINDGEKDVTILTDKNFLEDSGLEVGDKVEITAEKTEQGLKAVDYNYVYSDEEYQPEENENSEEEGQEY